MLGGGKPWDGESLMAILKLQRNRDWVTGEMLRDVPDPLGRVISGCVSRDAAQRWSTAGAALGALRDLEVGLPHGHARKPPASAGGLGKGKRIVAAAATVTALGVLAAAGSRILRETQQAEPILVVNIPPKSSTSDLSAPKNSGAGFSRLPDPAEAAREEIAQFANSGHATLETGGDLAAGIFASTFRLVVDEALSLRNPTETHVDAFLSDRILYEYELNPTDLPDILARSPDVRRSIAAALMDVAADPPVLSVHGNVATFIWDPFVVEFVREGDSWYLARCCDADVAAFK